MAEASQDPHSQFLQTPLVSTEAHLSALLDGPSATTLVNVGGYEDTSRQRRASSEPGYHSSGDGLAQYSKVSSLHRALSTPKSLLRRVLSEVNAFHFRSRDAKRLLAFIILNSAFSVAEMCYGLMTGRIALVSDAFHLLFGSGVLLLSLVAMVHARSPKDSIYTYGYERLDVLAGFTNALFLLFLSFSLAVEALHAFVEDESAHRHYLTLSAAANLVVNLLGVVFFRHFSRINIVYRRAQDMNHHSVLLHVGADSMRSAGIILASWLLAVGLPYAETLVNLLVASVVLIITLPLFYASGRVLLQTTPAGIPAGAISKCLRDASSCEGVIDSTDLRMWSHVPGTIVGTLCVRAKADADEQQILQHVHSIFSHLGVADMTVEIQKEADMTVKIQKEGKHVL